MHQKHAQDEHEEEGGEYNKSINITSQHAHQDVNSNTYGTRNLKQKEDNKCKKNRCFHLAKKESAAVIQHQDNLAFVLQDS